MLNETKHTFSGNPRVVKKRIIPLLNKAGIRRLKVKAYGDTQLDVQFDANNEEFGILKDLLKKDLGKEGGFKWKQANLKLEGIEKEIQEELKLKKKLKEMIKRESKMKLTKSKLKEIIREEIKQLNEARRMTLQITKYDRKRVQKILDKLRLNPDRDYDFGEGRGSTFILDFDKKHLDNVLELFIRNDVEFKEA